jgi:putative MATE family efflux protein
MERIRLLHPPNYVVWEIVPLAVASAPPGGTTIQRMSEGKDTAAAKYRQMTEEPIRPLILSLAAPSIVSNLVTSIYNLCDTFFVGSLGTSAEGAIGISFVVMTAMQAVGFGMGQGTGNAISRFLGARDRERACIMTTNGLATTFLLGTLIAILDNVFIEPICLVAGSTDTILPYAKTFIGIILLGAPFMCSSLMLNMQLRFEGEALHSMIAIMTGAIINIALEPLLIYVVGLGIAGSAIATVICQFISFYILVWQIQRVGITPLSPRWLRRPTRAMVARIVNGGLPSFVRQCMLGVATTLLNEAARPFGDAAIAALAVVQRIASIGNYVQIGIGQGFQPVIGYNYGAKLYERIRAGYRFSVRTAFVAVALLGVVTCVSAPQLIGLFSSDPKVLDIGTLALRVESFTLPLTGTAMITNFLLQTTGRMWRATILGACRLGLVLGPVVLVLPPILGLLGVQLAQPVTDVITFLVTIPMAWSILRELAEEERDARQASATAPAARR